MLQEVFIQRVMRISKFQYIFSVFLDIIFAHWIPKVDPNSQQNFFYDEDCHFMFFYVFSCSYFSQ